MSSADKLGDARNVLEQHQLSLAEAAFIGDDVHDIELLQNIGFSGAPQDAMTQVVDVVDYHCSTKGGAGAFREFADVILDAVSTGKRPDG